MSHAEWIHFILQLAIMLGISLGCGWAFRLLHQPAVLGEILGGILLGPTLFGRLFPDAFAWLFPATGAVVVCREYLIRIGMLFFLFSAGLEVNLAHMKERGRAVLTTSALGMALPFAIGAGAVLAFPGFFSPAGRAAPTTLALFLGTALSISALPVIARILIDLQLARHEIGTVILSSATVSDLVSWFLFAWILSSGSQDAGRLPVWLSLVVILLFVGAVLVIGRFMQQRVMERLSSHPHWPVGFIGISTVLVLLAAASAEAIGLHALFGAFLIGLALERCIDEKAAAEDVVQHFSVGFFAPLYFVSIGLTVDFAAGFDPVLVLVVVLAAGVGKIAGAGLGARLGGLSPRAAWAVGLGLNARGAVEIVMASVALEHRVIDQRLFVALVVMALLTSLASGPAIRKLFPEEAPGASRPL